MPICLAGSRITSEQVLETLGMRIPWGDGVGRVVSGMGKVGKGAQAKEIDRVHVRPMISNFHIGVLVLGLLLLTFLLGADFWEGLGEGVWR